MSKTDIFDMRNAKPKLLNNNLENQNHIQEKNILFNHEYFLRVYYEDTDSAGIVYYANYLKFTERARTEMMRSLGLTHSELKNKYDLLFAVRNYSINYLSPARLDDELIVCFRVSAVHGASLLLDQEISRKSSCLASASMCLVLINNDGKPSRLPENLRNLF